jgi:hypothetical protein
MTVPDGIQRMTVFVDSAEEQYAWLLATFGKPGTWSVESQSYRVDDRDQELEVTHIRTLDGSSVEVTFAPAHVDESPFGGEPVVNDRTGRMDDLMEKATTFAAENPPHHPGSIARFPIPSASYANAVSIPLPVLAVDGGRRGLYAPPRVVALNWKTSEPIGVGEFPDFDPEHWPPPRLGDWPPVKVEQEQLVGMIGRFSACWSRVLDTWFAKSDEVTEILRSDAREALAMRQRLDLSTMSPYYDRLNPVFAKWLATIAG